MNKAFGTALAVLASASLAACATTSKPAPGKGPSGASSQPAAPLARGLDPAASKDPFPSTYRPLPGRNLALVGATVLTGTGTQIENGTVAPTRARLRPGRGR